MIKVIIVEDHRMFREGVQRILSTDKIAEIIATFENGKDFIEALDNYDPDIVLMDISMPIMDGIEATKQALIKMPNLKILALTSFGEETAYFQMVEAGAKGFVLKTAGLSELEQAIKEVAAGGNWFSPDILQKVILSITSKPKKNSKIDLSEREIEILKFICNSLTNEQIAEQLNISYDTVKWHRANLLSKTGCNNTAGLVMYAIKNKFIDL